MSKQKVKTEETTEVKPKRPRKQKVEEFNENNQIDRLPEDKKRSKYTQLSDQEVKKLKGNAIRVGSDVGKGMEGNRRQGD